MFFPLGTQTYSEEICGINDFVAVSGDQFSILGVAMQQSNISSDTVIECGNTPIAKNYATNYSHVPMNYQCDDNIEISKSGQDCAFVIINYTPFFTNDSNNYPTTTVAYLEAYNPPIGINSTSSISVYGSFTAGEILIGFLILCLILISILRSIAGALGKIKTKRTYLQYGGGDVEIRDDL